MNSDVDLSQLASARRSGRQGVPRRRHLLTRYVLPCGLLAGFSALIAWSASDYLRPPLDVTVVPVTLVEGDVQRAGVPLFKAAGWIEARPTPIRVAALAPGVVERLLVVEDQLLAQGEPIAELVKDDAELALRQARAELDLRNAEVQQAEAKLAAAKTRFEDPAHLAAALGEAEANLAKIETQRANLPFAKRRAEANLLFARQDYDRKKSAADVIAARLLDEAKGRLDSAQAQVDELEVRASTLKREQQALESRRKALETLHRTRPDEKQALEEAQAQRSAALARSEQARVALAKAELARRRMTITAPVDGRVYRLIGHPGARVGGGVPVRHDHDSSTVVTMYQPEQLQVRVDVRFDDLPRVQLGQPVEIENAAVTRPLSGKVLFVSSEADIQKNTLEVKVLVDSPPPVFKPEMLVNVTFLAPEQKTPEATDDSGAKRLRIFVPSTLVRSAAGAKHVWVANKADHVARRASVETGAEAGELVEVTSGISVASWLIATRADELTDGMRIHVVGEEAGLAPPKDDVRQAVPPQADGDP